MIAVTILCGGSGSRLYPLSTRQIPKQFINLIDSEFTMFQLTIKRILKLPVDKITIICNQDHYDIANKQLNQIIDSNLKYSFILEPIGKNTAPAICLTSLLNPDDTILVVPSDHVFDDDYFVEKVKEGLNLINEGIVTFGVKPTHAETGFGYINYKDNNIIKFVEKPNKHLAEEYIKNGNYLWNSGVFLFKSEIILNELKNHCNDIYNDVSNIAKNFNLDDSIHKIDIKNFSNVRDQSIDFGVMEYHKTGKIVEYHGKWRDLGSFYSLYNELEKDSDGNVVIGDNICAIDCNNCYINTDRGKIGLIGLNDIAVVKVKDNLLISDINMTQQIKNFKFSNTEQVNETMYRPWGTYTTIDGGDLCGFKVKRITVKPGKRLSLQSHNHRSENWIVTKGTAKTQLNDKFIIMEKNDYIFIPVKAKHRIENIGVDELEFIEVQTGAYLGEDDIIRYQDDFNRI
jgi:mannose-1-phosphate guanylyltransferase/mannose-6-phosphate isomerase